MTKSKVTNKEFQLKPDEEREVNRKLKAKYKDNTKRWKHLSNSERYKLRPSSLIGAVESEPISQFLMDGDVMKLQNIENCEGLLKIIGEIIENAVDNTEPESKLKPGLPTTIIKVDVDTKTNQIDVANNGRTIMIAKKKGMEDYIPTLVVSAFNTGTNLTTDDRGGAGQNGYGVKLTNYLAKTFSVYCNDGDKYFKQTFRDGNTRRTKPLVAESKKKQTYSTKIGFEPDLSYFPDVTNLDTIEKQVHAKMIKISAYLGSVGRKTQVRYNKNVIKQKKLKDYMKLFSFDEKNSIIRKITGKNYYYEFGIGLNMNSTEFHQESCVVGLDTMKGGTHVNKLMSILYDLVRSKYKNITTTTIRQKIIHFCIL